MDGSTEAVGHYKSHGDYASARQNLEYFEAVIRAYVASRSLPPVAAINLDPDGHSHKLGPDSIHYCVDVERATEKALQTAELRNGWARIVAGEDVVASVRNRIVRLCAPIYRARDLSPGAYFLRIRKGRADRKAAA